MNDFGESFQLPAVVWRYIIHTNCECPLTLGCLTYERNAKTSHLGRSSSCSWQG